MKNQAFTLIDKYLASKLDWHHESPPLEFMSRLQNEMSPEMSFDAAQIYWIESYIAKTNDHWLDFLWAQHKESGLNQRVAA